MLQISLLPDEYFTINGDIVVQLSDVTGGRANLRVEADRSIPIVRCKVLERQGQPRPACLDTPPRRQRKRQKDLVYLWTSQREQAVRTTEQIAARLEEEGQREAAELLRIQLKRLVPTPWEEEISGELQPVLRDGAAGKR